MAEESGPGDDSPAEHSEPERAKKKKALIEEARLELSLKETVSKGLALLYEDVSLGSCGSRLSSPDSCNRNGGRTCGPDLDFADMPKF